MKNVLIKLGLLFDLILIPFTVISAFWLKFVRRVGVEKMKYSRNILFKIGVFPIRDHYYEPYYNPNQLKKTHRDNRFLPGIDFNVKEQLKILTQFNFNEELRLFPLEKTNNLEFYYHNLAYRSGDAEYLYNLIRLLKPKKLIEIGSGYSTLMAINAINQNEKEDSNYLCEHICIEPYEMHWLEKMGVKVIRELVENIDKELFLTLECNDILFIDSSHVIKPQGDVLYELQILQILKPGVLVHIHDIFTPKDYLNEWIAKNITFWNEQYLLEAFLTFNNQYKIVGALNYLKHNYFKELSDKCPILKNESYREPGAFWIMRC
jgi:predicted O-methyltransferase YrrM